MRNYADKPYTSNCCVKANLIQKRAQTGMADEEKPKTQHEQRKQQELQLLTQFRKLHPGFPTGNIISQEDPDFIIEATEGNIGVEIRQWAPDEAKSGSPMLKHESSSDLIVQRAKRLYDEKSLPALYVSANFHPGASLIKRDYNRIAEEIASIVKKTIPSLGEQIVLRYPLEGWRQLPREITSIYIIRLKNETEALWTSEMGGVIPEITANDIANVIRQKEERLVHYQTSADTVWLLIAATGFNPSGFASAAPELEKHVFVTSFHAVFLLLTWANDLLYLQTGASTEN